MEEKWFLIEVAIPADILASWMSGERTPADAVCEEVGTRLLPLLAHGTAISVWDALDAFDGDRGDDFVSVPEHIPGERIVSASLSLDGWSDEAPFAERLARAARGAAGAAEAARRVHSELFAMGGDWGGGLVLQPPERSDWGGWHVICEGGPHEWAYTASFAIMDACPDILVECGWSFSLLFRDPL